MTTEAPVKKTWQPNPDGQVVSVGTARNCLLYPPNLDTLVTVLPQCKGRNDREKEAAARAYVESVLESVRNAKNAVKILACTQKSFVSAVKQAAQYGFELDGILGHAYLVPYGNVCKMMPGYKGYNKLLLQSPEISAIDAHVVYKVDEFDYALGGEPFVKHRPEACEDSEMTEDQITHAYFVVWLKCGIKKVNVWPARKLWKRRDKYSKGYKSNSDSINMWRDHPDIAAIKTVIRDSCARGMLPVSTDIVSLASHDEYMEADEAAKERAGERQQSTSMVNSLDELTAALKADGED
ncbi:recombinase RecT [Rosistilla oblonga]|uniref:recombinase RecT n=1 Tax=Rosistilla oblonga TaxID=2527990 RepID=UPI003A986490